ncbi:hypothetical protein OB955_17045 [Halobacteria archaeon AArc-m2/3/4]|uniref:Uncharacterized protein n=1 Tax=Natronoglomus mannanivorans TaxID=2979990 RepID=A0ABT2QHL5_9EURY|nr:hypothetical protein [Halobacteria archaeon AArc-m2/3/4]
MRRRYLLLLVVPVAVLLALGALPSLIGGGDVYYVTAAEIDLEDGEPAHENVTETIPADNLSTNRFPYTMSALEADDGVSDSYEEGRFGFKESFTHTPFDEFGELEIWESNAVDGDAVWVEQNGTFYRLEITQTPETDNGSADRSDRLGVARIAH